MRKRGIAAEGVEHRAQVARVLGAQRMSAPLSGPKRANTCGVVIAQRPGMQLHHEAIVHRHLRHLHQHVRSKRF
jgi:hypothetical protein